MMRQRIATWSATLALGAGVLVFAGPPASAAVAECPILPAAAGVGTVSGTVTGPTSEERATVFVVDVETGGMSCAVTAADGSYSATLPGVPVTDSNPRKPADAWLIIASPSPSSSLGSASRLLPTDLVALGTSVPGQNLTLAESDLAVTAFLDGESTAIDGAVIACLLVDSGGIPTTCGVTVGSPLPVARLTIPAGGPFVVDAYFPDAGTWFQGTAAGDPVARDGGVSSLEVVLEQESVTTCPTNNPAVVSVTGTVTRDGSQGVVPTRADVEVFANVASGGYYDQYTLGWTTSNRDGSYVLCVSEEQLPQGVSFSDVMMTLRASPLAGGITKHVAWSPSMTTVDVEIPATPQVGGSITYGGQSTAASVTWSVYEVITEGQDTYIGANAAYGRTTFAGGWGVDGLPDGDYELRAYPRERGFAVNTQRFTVSSDSVVNLDLPAGNVVGRVVKPNGGPESYAWVSAFDPSTCNQNGCDFFGGNTDEDGYFTLLVRDGTYQVTVYPGWGPGDTVDTSLELVVSGSSVTCSGSCSVADGSLTITMDEPNSALKLLAARADQEPLVLTNTYLEVERWVGSNDNSWPWNSQGGGVSGETGEVPLRLESGFYKFTVRPHGSASIPATSVFMRSTVADGQVTLASCPALIDPTAEPCTGETTPLEGVEGVWPLTVPLANLRAVVTSPTGTAVDSANYQLFSVVPGAGGGSNVYWIQSGSADRDGNVPVHLDAEGTYRLTLALPDAVQENWVGTSYYFTRTAEGVCLMDSPATACTPTSDWEGDLAFGLPNVAGTVLGAGGAPFGNTWLEISQPCDWFDGCREPYYDNPGTFVGLDGTFLLNLPDDDTYIFTVHPWQAADGSVQTSFTVPIGAGESLTGANALTLQLRGANVTGRITTSTGTPATNSWVGVDRFVGIAGDGYWEGVNAGSSTDSNGDFGLALDAGTYRLRVEPGSAWRTVAVSTIQDDSFVLTSSSDTKVVNISLGAPNLRGQVLDPGGNPAGNGWVEARKWDDRYQQYMWDGSTSGSGTSSSGEYAFDLSDGRWELIANPPWGTEGASRSATRIIMSANGTSVCLDNGSGACAGSALDRTDFDLTLGSPNVRGSVVDPDGNAVSNTWLDIQVWSDLYGQYIGSPDIQGVPVSFAGAFAVTLPDGQYRLTAQPPYGITTVSRGSIDIRVSSSGSSVCVIDGDACNAAPASGVVVQLASPNLSGTVTVPDGQGTPVARTSISVQKWRANGGYWEWVDVWTNTNDSGEFAVSLQESGTYRVTAEPGVQNSGYSRGYAYVYADGSGLCQLNGKYEAETGGSCATTGSLDLQMQLAGANLVGSVTAGGSAAPWAWVEIFRKTQYGLDWADGVNANQQGRFAATLEPNNLPQEYQLRINPPWQSGGEYAKRSVTVWAFDDGGTTRVCTAANWDAGAQTCNSPITSAAPLAVTLTGGNLRGQVVSPGASPEPVAETSVSVEKWVETPWNPGSGVYTWQWTELWANGNSQGTFALNVEDTGVYRVTARPPWNSANNWTNGEVIVRVTEPNAGEFRWCTVNDSASSTADPFGACTSLESTESSSLSVALREPNVSVIVSNGTSGVANAWVGIRKSVTVGSSTYWEWLGGDSTRRDGTFGTVIDEAGTYSLEINPPWDNTSGLTRFTQDFTVTCTTTCTTDLPGTVTFPAANVQGAVADPDDINTLVPNAWVSVEQWDDALGQYTWIDKGTTTNRQGQFNLALSEDDTYRLTANPSWSDPKGVRTSAIVEVVGGTATCVSGCASGFTIQLGAPNVTGLVTDGSTPMSYSWVEVRDLSGNWVTGTDTGQSGRYSLSLSPGTYTLRAYPNWNLTSRPPRDVVVTVPASGVVTQDIDLSAVTPNVTMCINVISASGPVSTSRAVIVEEWTGSAYELLSDYTTRSEPGSGSCATEASWFLPDGTYRFTVMPDLGETFTSSNVSANVVVSGGAVTSGSTNIPVIP